MFLLVFLEFFCFFLVLDLQNQKNLGKFWFFEFIVSSKRGKTKNYLGKFWFFEFTVSSKRGKTKNYLGIFWLFGS